MSWKEDKKRLIPILFVLFTVIAFVLGGVSQFSREKESILEMTFLFLPPLIVQGFGAFSLWPRSKDHATYYSFNLAATFLTLFFCYLSWFFYSYLLVGHPQWQQFWSILILVVILLIVALVVTMTFAITRPTEFHWEFCDDLYAGVKDHPFWAIMFFITLFLGVAYLFGFVLAFHDQFARSKRTKDGAEMAALRMVHFDTIDDPTLSPTANDSAAKQAAQNDDDSESNVSKVKDSDNPSATAQKPSAIGGSFCFYFNDIRAHLDTQPSTDCGTVIPPSRLDSNLKKPAQFNYCSLTGLTRQLREKLDDGQKVRVMLIGHTSNEQPKGSDSTPKRYLSNYELSEARAQDVKYELMQQLADSAMRGNIDWIIFATADEPVRQVIHGALTKNMFSDVELRTKFDPARLAQEIRSDDIEGKFSDEETDRKLTPDEKRVVIATIEPVPQDRVVAKTEEMTGQIGDITHGQTNTLKELRVIRHEVEQHLAQSKPNMMKLMDYMYFSIYTITTTGYGDIIPTTAYAKFVISIANLCEVLFLVVFFNSLFSLSQASRQDTDRKRSAQLDLPLNQA